MLPFLFHNNFSERNARDPPTGQILSIKNRLSKSFQKNDLKKILPFMYLNICIHENFKKGKNLFF